MAKPRFKIYERDSKQRYKFIYASEDRKDVVSRFEKHKAKFMSETVLIMQQSEGEEVEVAVKEPETASLEYIEEVLTGLKIDKKDKDFILRLVKMYKYKKCDEMKEAAKLYSERYINLSEKSMSALLNQLSLLPHPSD